MNWDKIDAKYDLDHPVHVTKTLSWVADQMIHSFAFLPSFDDEGRLDAVLFNSDRTRRQQLYSFAIDKIVTLFEEIGANDPASIHLQFNERTGDYDVHVGATMEPGQLKVRRP